MARSRIYRTNADRQRAYRQRRKRSVHFRSTTDLWSTPQPLFDTLNAEFGFTLDVCALPDNAKCAAYFTPIQDGLQQVWTGSCWCNPPYGAVIGRWVQKAYESAQAGALVVCLLPARPDTGWWHHFVMRFAEVRFLKGRLKFGGARNSAPFPSAVVIFKPRAEVTSREVEQIERESSCLEAKPKRCSR
jgi:phage N-6-adenine-methyltransferase